MTDATKKKEALFLPVTLDQYKERLITHEDHFHAQVHWPGLLGLDGVETLHDSEPTWVFARIQS